jgi:tRNA (cmo5U34)-methyltransferase
MAKDEIFKEESGAIADFKFEGKVVSVFDDMLDRSVPFYQEIQRMICEMAGDFAVSGTQIYDLGCSTGTTLLNLNRWIGSRVKYVGLMTQMKCCTGVGKNWQKSFQGNTISSVLI